MRPALSDRMFVAALAILLLPEPALAQDAMPASPTPAEIVSEPAPQDAAPPVDRTGAMAAWTDQQRSDFATWPEQVKTYYWSLPEGRQKLFWKLSVADRERVSAMTPADQAAAWQVVEARAATPHSEAKAPKPSR